MKPLIIVLFFCLTNTLLSQTVTFTPMGGKTIYDLQSNGVPQYIVTNPDHPEMIHAVYMRSPYNDDTLFSARNTYYYFSSNGGMTWYDNGIVSAGQNTFPSISLLQSDITYGPALISCNRIIGMENLRAVVYADVMAGLGSFTPLDPGSGKSLVWPQVVATSGTNDTNKFVLIGTPINSTNSIVLGKSLEYSIFDYSQTNINFGSSDIYAIARGSDGRIGIAYTQNNTDRGDVFFMESTNNGQTFTSIKIFNSIEYSNVEFLGAFKGISIVYLGNVPNIVFETVRQTTTGSFYPNISSQIRFWSTNLQGSDPNKCITIADSTNVPFFPMLTYDVEAPVCRPVIGASKDKRFIYAAFISSSGQSLNNRSYKDIYIMRSANGISWNTPERINPVSPRMDYSYVSMSPVITSTPTEYRVDLSVQRDTIPGTHVNGAAKSYAENIYVNYTQIYIPPCTKCPPNAPFLISPYDRSIAMGGNPLLVWDSTVGNSYKLQLSRDSTFSFTNINLENLSAASYQTDGLAPNIRYYWRVKAQNQYGESGWSTVWDFISNPIGISNESETAYEYKLFNNYPNPFNPETNIKFSLPENDIVSLSIYDVKGMEVGRLLNNQKINSGVYNFKFNASRLTSGIYFYRLKTSRFTETKKMMLIK